MFCKGGPMDTLDGKSTTPWLVDGKKAIKKFVIFKYQNHAYGIQFHIELYFQNFPEKITFLQYPMRSPRFRKTIKMHFLASSPETTRFLNIKIMLYGIQFHIEVKDTTVNEWGCVPEYKKALEETIRSIGALEKFDNDAQANMKMRIIILIFCIQNLRVIF